MLKNGGGVKFPHPFRNRVKIISKFVKMTVVILSDPKFIKLHVVFSTVPLKTFSDQE